MFITQTSTVYCFCFAVKSFKDHFVIANVFLQILPLRMPEISRATGNRKFFQGMKEKTSNCESF